MIRKAPWLRSVRIIDIVIDQILKFRPYIPFTAPNTVWRSLDKKAKIILDLGCGKGQPMKFINRRKQFATVGADAFEPYLREAQSQNTHHNFVLCDIRQLPFQHKSFDVVLCLEVLEHLEKEEMEKLLQAMEEITRKQVVISTPVGRYEQESFDQNPVQKHRSVWVPSELEKNGYRVRGVGIRGLGGDSGLTSRLPKVLRPLHYLLQLFTGPVINFFPGLAVHMVATKKAKEQ